MRSSENGDWRYRGSSPVLLRRSLNFCGSEVVVSVIPVEFAFESLEKKIRIILWCRKGNEVSITACMLVHLVKCKDSLVKRLLKVFRAQCTGAGCKKKGLGHSAMCTYFHCVLLLCQHMSFC